MKSKLETTLDLLPTFLLETEAGENTLRNFRNKLNEYFAQSYVMSLCRQLDAIQGEGPEFSIDFYIADEDSILLWYLDGADGVEVDEDAFDTIEDREAYQKRVNEELERFAECVNSEDYVDGHTRNFEETFFKCLNEVSWRKSERKHAIVKAFKEFEWDGGGFVAALEAKTLNENTVLSTALPKRKPGL